jgi:drug/metabolite transporter (DMT)-like permease
MIKNERKINQIWNSYQKNWRGIFLILITSLTLALSQFFWKISSGTNFFWIIAGFFIAGVGMVIMIIAYRYGSLSVIHPFMSMSYVIGIGLGVLVLNERINSFIILGIILIILGNIFIGGGDE